MQVVSDAGPLHYLVLIKQDNLLGQIFDAVVMPDAVRAELDDSETPAQVRAWIAAPPPWLSVSPASLVDVEALPRSLGRGERAAIALATRLRPGLVLLDDRAGVAAARMRGFAATGTLGILYRAAKLGLVDLEATFDQLKATNFHHTPVLLEGLLARFKAGGSVP